MNRRSRPAAPGVVLAVAAVLVLTAPGCGGVEEPPERSEIEVADTSGDVEPLAEVEPDAKAETTRDGRIGDDERLEGEPVKIALTDYDIDMPREIEAGEIDLVILNSGDHEHAFRIGGPAVDLRFGPIPPNGSVEGRVVLSPGSYHVWCPIEDHAERGMERDIEVVEPD